MAGYVIMAIRGELVCAGKQVPILPEMSDQRADRFFQLLAFDNHVNHAVIEQEFGSLELVRQLLFDRLLDHARARQNPISAFGSAMMTSPTWQYSR